MHLSALGTKQRYVEPPFGADPSRFVSYPTNARCRRVSPIAARPGEGRLTEPTAAARLSRQQRRPMPRSRPRRREPGSAESGGNASFPICPAVMPMLEKQTFTHGRRDRGFGSCLLAARQTQTGQEPLSVLG